MFFLVRTLWFIIQFMYLSYRNMETCKKKLHYLTEEKYQYEVNNIPKVSTIVSKKGKGTHLLILLSGSVNIGYRYYIHDTIKAMMDCYYNTMCEYDIVVFENNDHSSFSLKTHINHYIQDFIKSNPNMEELILLGFSAGGIVASHIMSDFKHLPNIKKKIITYDSTWCAMHHLDYYSNTWMHRLDMFFYYEMYNAFKNHHDYQEIEEHLINKSCFGGGFKDIKCMLKAVHNFDEDDLLDLLSFNLNQNNDCIVISINCSKDPIINQELNEQYFKSILPEVKFKHVQIKKPVIGHCTDMIYGNHFVHDIIDALRY